MAGTFKFELVTPERMLLSEDANQVVVPGTEGDFTVLQGHAPVISGLRPGVIDVELAGSRKLRVFVKGGFAEVDTNHLTVLAQKAYDLQSMDAAIIAAELQIAESDLAAAASDAARRDAHAAVDGLRALQR
jgi:F-type H+-transporting ATPase subunit epsilon